MHSRYSMILTACVLAVTSAQAGCGANDDGHEPEPIDGGDTQPEAGASSASAGAGGSTPMAGAGSGTSGASAGQPPDPSDDDASIDEVPGNAHGIVPLFNASTELEPDVVFDRGDAIVTRLGDLARDRHAREDEFQSYDHYLPHYWEHRTARIRFVDYVSKGGGTIDVSFVSEWKLSVAELRAWYYGMGTVAHYHGN